jgi:hypothetical protein
LYLRGQHFLVGLEKWYRDLDPEEQVELRELEFAQ